MKKQNKTIHQFTKYVLYRLDIIYFLVINHKENNNTIANRTEKKILTSFRTKKIAEKKPLSTLEFDNNGPLLKYAYSSGIRSKHDK